MVFKWPMQWSLIWFIEWFCKMFHGLLQLPILRILLFFVHSTYRCWWRNNTSCLLRTQWQWTWSISFNTKDPNIYPDPLSLSNVFMYCCEIEIVSRHTIFHMICISYSNIFCCINYCIVLYIHCICSPTSNETTWMTFPPIHTPRALHRVSFVTCRWNACRLVTCISNLDET